jgi:hypothetical protein
MLYVSFYNSSGYSAGSVQITFDSPPQYMLEGCTELIDTNFPKDLPTATDKVWRITKTRTSGIRLVIHCNEVEVLNFLISDSTCSEHFSWGLEEWSENVTRIEFSSYDEASDYYRPMMIG